jgi:hypothetical protein
MFLRRISEPVSHLQYDTQRCRNSGKRCRKLEENLGLLYIAQ